MLLFEEETWLIKEDTVLKITEGTGLLFKEIDITIDVIELNKKKNHLFSTLMKDHTFLHEKVVIV